jgi:hypothetical protein
MSFVNPIEILGLQYLDIAKIDSNCIRQAKRRLFAEIDLSDDGILKYGGSKVTRTDAERRINELDDKERIEFYHFVANYYEFNNFLISGDKSFFSSYREESIFKLQSFVSFISPFFAEQYDRVSFQAFQNDKINSFKRIITVLPIVTVGDKDKAYKSIAYAIKQKIKEIDVLALSIKNHSSPYDENNLHEISDWVDSLVNVDILNLLPSYFQSMRNQTAMSLRHLSVYINNYLKNSTLALDIINYALTLNIDGLVEQRITEDYHKIIDININDNDLKEKRASPIPKKYDHFIEILYRNIAYIKEKTVSASSVLDYLRSSLSINELNSLDISYDETRKKIASALNSLASFISIDSAEINTALEIINIAESINLNEETKKLIANTKNQLTQVKNKIQAQRVHTNFKSRLPNEKQNTLKRKTVSRKQNSTILIILTIVVVFMIIISIAKPKKSIPQMTPYILDSKVLSPQTKSESVPNIQNTSKEESIYKGNQLENGMSPFDDCFGKGIYGQGANAYITFHNGNSYDAVVCLVDIITKNTIRNEYIRAGSDFTMSKLPSGTYYMKVYFGKDWNPLLYNFCGTRGAFETDVHFSKSDNTSDYLKISNTEYSYTTGSITLYAVTGGNMTTENTTPSDFFTK